MLGIQFVYTKCPVHIPLYCTGNFKIPSHDGIIQRLSSILFFHCPPRHPPARQTLLRAMPTADGLSVDAAMDLGTLSHRMSHIGDQGCQPLADNAQMLHARSLLCIKPHLQTKPHFLRHCCSSLHSHHLSWPSPCRFPSVHTASTQSRRAPLLQK